MSFTFSLEMPKWWDATYLDYHKSVKNNYKRKKKRKR